MRWCSPTGWRRAAIAFAAGAVSVLALAPVNAWPVLFVTFPVAGVADRRRVRRTARRRHDGSAERLVVRLRLFRRGPLLDGLCVSGRCQDLRVAVAVRGCRPSGGARILHGGGLRRRAAHLDARTVPHLVAGACPDGGRMAARPCADRLSVEHDRLCAHRSAGAGAGLRADRAVGADVLCGLAVCKPRGAGRRARRYAAPVADGADPRHAARDPCGLRCRAPCAVPDPIRRRA